MPTLEAADFGLVAQGKGAQAAASNRRQRAPQLLVAVHRTGTATRDGSAACGVAGKRGAADARVLLGGSDQLDRPRKLREALIAEG